MGKPGMMIALGIAVALSACAEDTEQSSEVIGEQLNFVGFLDGTDAVVGLAATESHAAGYSCGGDDSLEEHTEWFMGETVVDGSSVFIDCGQTHFVAEIRDGVARGQIVDEHGVAWSFTAMQTRPDTIAGLYIDRGGRCSTGAVVIQDDPEQTPYVQGAWCDGWGTFRQVVPMKPVQVTADGLAVRVPRKNAPMDFMVQPFSF